MIKIRRMSRACSTNGGVGNAYRIFVGKAEGKRPLGRPRRKWDNIKMDRTETGWGVMDWIDMDQDREKWKWNTVINLRVP
jgi:hypothetical protein